MASHITKSKDSSIPFYRLSRYSSELCRRLPPAGRITLCHNHFITIFLIPPREGGIGEEARCAHHGSRKSESSSSTLPFPQSIFDCRVRVTPAYIRGTGADGLRAICCLMHPGLSMLIEAKPTGDWLNIQPTRGLRGRDTADGTLVANVGQAQSPPGMQGSEAIDISSSDQKPFMHRESP